MRKVLALAGLGLALVSFGCAGGGMATKESKPITKETVVKCPKCGAEFQVGQGLSVEEKKP